jgi:L-glutamine-phosphate cytidylyltransferase
MCAVYDGGMTQETGILESPHGAVATAVGTRTSRSTAMTVQAVILAAGKGSRLETVSNGHPKCLLDVGGRPLLEHQLEAFADAGVGPVVMALGYRADEVRAAAGDRVTVVVNERWEKTGSLASFWKTREAVRGPVVIANGDLLFHPEILDRLLEGESSAIAYDSASGDGREHMKVSVASGRVVDIAKDLPRDAVSGENVGLLRFNADDARRLFAHAETLIRNGRETGWLAEAVRATAAEVPIRGVDVAGLPWTEVDFPYDLDRARREVWPAIRRSRRRLPRWWRRVRWAALALACLCLPAAGWYFGTPKIEWNSIPLKGGKKVRVAIRESTQKWWLLPDDHVGKVTAEGPEPVRIECRPLLPLGLAGKVPVELVVTVDDGPPKSYSFQDKADPDLVLDEEHPVGARNRVEFDLPPGPHAIRIRSVTGGARGCLVRVRQPQHIE